MVEIKDELPSQPQKKKQMTHKVIR